MIKLCKILEVSSLKKKMLIQEFHNLFFWTSDDKV